MTLIQDVTTREILNERGEPTLEADVSLACGALGRASVPADVRDELRDRDDDTRYFGRGVQRALEQVRDRICLVVRGLDALDQVAVDHELGTLERLGGNARLVVTQKDGKVVEEKVLFTTTYPAITAIINYGPEPTPEPSPEPTPEESHSNVWP